MRKTRSKRRKKKTGRNDHKSNQDTICRWYSGSNYERLKLIDYPEWFDRNKGQNINDIVYKCLKNNENMKEEKRQALVNIVNTRIEKFEKLINKKNRK